MLGLRIGLAFWLMSLLGEAWGQYICYVSIPPQVDIVQKIGGRHVDVRFMVQPGDSEEAYQLSPQQRQQLTRADFYFYIGFAFELSLIHALEQQEKKSPNQLQMIDAKQGMQLISSGGCAHCHTSIDPHVWLDPINMLRFAETVAQALSKVDPQHQSEYQHQLKIVEQQLKQLDQTLAAILQPLKDRTILVFHPSFGYLGQRYGFKQLSIQPEGKEPSARELKQLIDQSKQQALRTIFIQPNFDTRVAHTLSKSLNAQLVVVDPLAGGSYAQMMQTLAQQLIQK